MIRSIFLTLFSISLMSGPVKASNSSNNLGNSLMANGKDFSLMLGKTAVQAVVFCTAAYFVLKRAGDYILKEMEGKDFKVYQPGEIKENFASLAGFEMEKAYFSDILAYLKDPQPYKDLGIQPSCGILLIGGPGTGKTTLARAVAGEANCAFIYASADDFGNGARVKKIFEQAKQQNSPCIIFLDEFESLAAKRDGNNSDGKVTTLLTELDGFVKNQTHPVIVIAATNFEKDKLDPAMLRPGRLETIIAMQYLKFSERKAILEFHLSKMAHEKDMDLSSIAQRTQFFTPADLAAIVQSAARLAVSDYESLISLDHVEEALDIKQFGYPCVPQPSEEVQEITAYHEAGHAVIGILTQPEMRLSSIHIIARTNGAGGTTHGLMKKEEERSISKDEFLNMIAMGLGGRAAEEIIFNLISNGPSSDLDKATDIAKDMVMKFGMGNFLAVQKEGKELDKKQISVEIDQILNIQYERSKQLLIKNIDLLHELAQELLQKKKLTSQQIYEIVDKFSLKL